MSDLMGDENQARDKPDTGEPIPDTGGATWAEPLSRAQAEKRPKEKEKTKTPEEEKPRKSAEHILEQEVSSGLEEIERSTAGLLMSGLSAGMDLGFSVFLMATLMTLTRDVFPRPATELLVALAYSLGFLLVVIGKSELFTEHTTLAILPVLNREANIGQLLRLWGLVLVANLVGGAIFAGLAAIIGPALGIIDPSSFGEIARSVISHSWWVILLSAVLAGWLMGLLSWLVAASRDTVGQILIIVAITGTIGIAHLHHSIAGNTEVLVGMFAGQGITALDYLHFLVFTIAGNLIGGVVFVALVKFGHAVQNQPDKQVG